VSERRPVPAVGVICFRGDEVLLIRRGKPPRAGEWSLPGGRVEWGETLTAAAERELMEEAGVEAEILGLVDVVDGVFPADDRHYILVDYAARWVAGAPQAGDDAAEAMFVPRQDICRLIGWDQTRRVIDAAWARFGQV
jgi:8-oxo-dGTP diphosphatase